LPAEFGEYRERFVAAMDDDFNTPQALGALFDFGRALNRAAEQKAHDFARGARELWSLMATLGFEEPTQIRNVTPEISAQITALIRARAEARQGRDWKRADELRAELERLDVALKDTPSGTEWKWKGA